MNSWDKRIKPEDVEFETKTQEDGSLRIRAAIELVTVGTVSERESHKPEAIDYVKNLLRHAVLQRAYGDLWLLTNKLAPLVFPELSPMNLSSSGRHPAVELMDQIRDMGRINPSPENQPKLACVGEKEHILRCARGAERLGYSMREFVDALVAYLDDESALDRQPLLAWWNNGGD